MSECDPLSRPTWVLGVILRKEALYSFRNSFHWLVVSFIDFSSLLPFHPELTVHTAVGLKNEFDSRRA